MSRANILLVCPDYYYQHMRAWRKNKERKSEGLLVEEEGGGGSCDYPRIDTLPLPLPVRVSREGAVHCLLGDGIPLSSPSLFHFQCLGEKGELPEVIQHLLTTLWLVEVEHGQAHHMICLFVCYYNILMLHCSWLSNHSFQIRFPVLHLHSPHPHPTSPFHP